MNTELCQFQNESRDGLCHNRGLEKSGGANTAPGGLLRDPGQALGRGGTRGLPEGQASSGVSTKLGTVWLAQA